MPAPLAASSAPCGTDSIPAIVARVIGSRPYSANAISAGSAPKPISGTAIASTATGGTVWPTATRVSTSGRNSRPAGRVTKMPAATPTSNDSALDAATIATCATNSETKLSCS